MHFGFKLLNFGLHLGNDLFIGSGGLGVSFGDLPLADHARRRAVLDRFCHALSCFFQFGYLLLFLNPKFLRPEPDIVSLFHTQEKLSEVHILCELVVFLISL